MSRTQHARSHSLKGRRCSEPGCINMARGERLICDTCTIKVRRRLGLCPNCGSEREKLAVINSITKRQLHRNGEPVFVMKCTGCGREQRART